MAKRKEAVRYARLLVRAMRALGMSIRSLSRETGLDRAGLRRILRGEMMPRWRTALAISRALGLSLDYFAGYHPLARTLADLLFESVGESGRNGKAVP